MERSVKDHTVRRVTPADLDLVAPLFDSYRQFYGRPGDRRAARGFLRERMSQGESVIFLAEAGAGDAVGFAQLYPTFSSLSLARVLILNDLFVRPDHRTRGVGSSLLAACSDYARSQKAARLTLSTAHDNHAAQALYEARGWTRDNQFVVYNLAL